MNHRERCEYLEERIKRLNLIGLALSTEDDLDKLLEDPVVLLLKGLLYILGFTLADELILSILFNLSLKLTELDLSNLSLMYVFEKLLDLDEIIFLGFLLPLTNETFVLKFLPYGL